MLERAAAREFSSEIAKAPGPAATVRELGAAAIVTARRRAVASCRRVVVASSLYSVVLGER